MALKIRSFGKINNFIYITSTRLFLSHDYLTYYEIFSHLGILNSDIKS